MSSTLEYWVRLGLAFGTANDRTDEIIRQFGTAEQFFDENGMETLPERDRARILRTKPDDAKRVVEKMEKSGVTILTPDDERYPKRLRGIWGMPLALYVDGSLDGLDDRLAIAMVGTRECSDYGFRAAVKIARELSRAGAVVVSGLAHGIDTACHTAAVKEDAPTVAVLGCGIDTTYPPQNTTLRELIAKKGAVVTEYAPGTGPLAANFPKRNRIISGLSVGVIVVEAGLPSGSLITAGLAAEQGRDVFAVPGDIFRPSAKGTFQLLQQGCAPVSCGADVLEEYRYRFALTLEPEPPQEAAPSRAKQVAQLEQTLLNGVLEPAAEEAQSPGVAPNTSAPAEPVQEPPGLSPDASAVFRLLAEGGARIEELAQRMDKPVHTVLAALTELELHGAVSARPGGRYLLTR